MRLFPIALLALAVACGSTTEPGAGASYAGTYTLRSIDAQPLPIAAPDSTLVSSSLALADDSTWSQLTLVKYPHKATNDTLPDQGRWTGEGGNFAFLSGGTVVYTGTGSASGFTLKSGASTFVFTK
jgi:hypothetical protein